MDVRGGMVVLVVTVALLAGAGRADATALSAFHTPAWAAYCFVPFPHERPLSSATLVCVTPDDGFTLEVGTRGRVRYRYDRSLRGSRDPFAARRLLPFGRHWAVKPYFHCVSRATGLTCWNKSGRGWWLGRARGYRIL